MYLEAIARDPAAFPRLELRSTAEGRLELQAVPTSAAGCADCAGAVHASLADGIVQIADRLRALCGPSIVGLTGGVFQNRRLTEAALAGLSARGFDVLLPVQLPCNDGGLSYGQVADFVGRND